MWPNKTEIKWFAKLDERNAYFEGLQTALNFLQNDHYKASVCESGLRYGAFIELDQVRAREIAESYAAWVRNNGGQ